MKRLSLFTFKLTLLLCLFFLGFVGLIVNIGYIFVELFDNGINTLIKIISSSKQELIEGLDSEKLGEKIYENIKTALTNIKPADLLGATGVFGEGMGQRKLEALFESIPDILSMKSNSELKDLVMKTPGFSDISADLVIDNLKYAISFMESIKPFIINDATDISKQKKKI